MGLEHWLCCKPTELIFRASPLVTASERQPRQHFEDDRSRRVCAVDTIGKNSYYPDERRIAMLHGYVTVVC